MVLTHSLSPFSRFCSPTRARLTSSAIGRVCRCGAVGGHADQLGSADKASSGHAGGLLCRVRVAMIALVDRWAAERRSVLFWGGCLAGVSFGFSWLCKESVRLLAPFCLAYVVMSIRQGGRGAVLLGGSCGGSLSILLGEVIAYLNVTGDPLFRFPRDRAELPGTGERLLPRRGSDSGWQKGQSYSRALARGSGAVPR